MRKKIKTAYFCQSLWLLIVRVEEGSSITLGNNKEKERRGRVKNAVEKDNRGQSTKEKKTGEIVIPYLQVQQK